MNRAVLDTHVLVWWRQGIGDRLSLPQKRLLERLDREGEFVISVITLWVKRTIHGVVRYFDKPLKN